MGIFDGILGGQGGLNKPATNAKTTAITPHSGGIQPLQNSGALWQTNAVLQHNNLINNPSMWNQQQALTPYGETMELKEHVKKLEYILQRTVENYEELQEQYKALQDITKAGENK